MEDLPVGFDACFAEPSVYLECVGKRGRREENCSNSVETCRSPCCFHHHCIVGLEVYNHYSLSEVIHAERQAVDTSVAGTSTVDAFAAEVAFAEDQIAHHYQGRRTVSLG